MLIANLTKFAPKIIVGACLKSRLKLYGIVITKNEHQPTKTRPAAKGRRPRNWPNPVAGDDGPQERLRAGREAKITVRVDVCQP